MATYKDVIEGLKILAKYDEMGLDGHGVEAHHDIIHAGPMLAKNLLSDEDHAKLLKLGWYIDDRTSSWAKFT